MTVDVKDRIDIRRLVVEEPEKQHSPFDPKVDIPQEVWDRLTAELLVRGTRLNFETAGILRDISIVDRVTGEGHLPFKPSYERVESDRLYEAADLRTELRMLAALNIAYPNSIKEYAPNLMYSTVQTQFKFDKRNRNNDDYLYEAIALDPAAVAVWHDLWPDMYENFRKTAFSYTRPPGFIFAQFAARAKIIFPDKFANFGMDQQIWDGLNEQLKLLPKLNYEGVIGALAFAKDFAEFARDLTILAADRVWVDDTGLHLEFEEKEVLVSVVPQLPEVKKYGR